MYKYRNIWIIIQIWNILGYCEFSILDLLASKYFNWDLGIHHMRKHTVHICMYNFLLCMCNCVCVHRCPCSRWEVYWGLCIVRDADRTNYINCCPCLLYIHFLCIYVYKGCSFNPDKWSDELTTSLLSTLESATSRLQCHMSARMVWNYTFCWITICGSQR